MALLARPDPQGCTARWIAGTLVLTGALWIAGFASWLAIAARVHVDIPYAQAVKLPPLQSRPDLIFAGESRTPQMKMVLVFADRNCRNGKVYNFS